MKKIRRDTLIFYLKNSEEEIELEDILKWLSQYSGEELKLTGEKYEY